MFENSHKLCRILIPPKAFGNELARMKVLPVDDQFISKIELLRPLDQHERSRDILSTVLDMTVIAGNQSISTPNEPVSVTCKVVLPECGTTTASLCLGVVNEVTNTWECVDTQVTTEQQDSFTLVTGKAPHFR